MTGRRFERKGLPPIKRTWWDGLPNRGECVKAVRSYIAQVEATTGMAALDRRLSYGPAEEMIIDSIAANDVEVESAIKRYTDLTEEVRNKARDEEGRTRITRVGNSWGHIVVGMDSKEVKAKASELIEALKPYCIL